MEAQEEDVTPVIFRRWREKEGALVAVLLCPRNSVNPGKIMCFERVGQHGEGDWSAITARTRLVKAEDAADVAALRRELESSPYGYKLREVKRIPRGYWSS